MTGASPLSLSSFSLNDWKVEGDPSITQEDKREDTEFSSPPEMIPHVPGIDNYATNSMILPPRSQDNLPEVSSKRVLSFTNAGEQNEAGIGAEAAKEDSLDPMDLDNGPVDIPPSATEEVKTSPGGVQTTQPGEEEPPPATVNCGHLSQADAPEDPAAVVAAVVAAAFTAAVAAVAAEEVAAAAVAAAVAAVAADEAAAAAAAEPVVAEPAKKKQKVDEVDEEEEEEEEAARRPYVEGPADATMEVRVSDRLHGIAELDDGRYYRCLTRPSCSERNENSVRVNYEKYHVAKVIKDSIDTRGRVVPKKRGSAMLKKTRKRKRVSDSEERALDIQLRVVHETMAIDWEGAAMASLVTGHSMAAVKIPWEVFDFQQYPENNVAFTVDVGFVAQEGEEENGEETGVVLVTVRFVKPLEL